MCGCFVVAIHLSADQSLHPYSCIWLYLSACLCLYWWVFTCGWKWKKSTNSILNQQMYLGLEEVMAEYPEKGEQQSILNA